MKTLIIIIGMLSMMACNNIQYNEKMYHAADKFTKYMDKYLEICDTASFELRNSYIDSIIMYGDSVSYYYYKSSPQNKK